MVKRGRRLFTSIIVVACVHISSCGIDTLSALDYEPVSKSSSISALTFEGPSGSETEYKGVFVFYKIYAYENSAITDRSTISTKQNADDAVPGSLITSYLTTTSGLGYKACILNNEEFIPTLKNSLISGKSISINFSGFEAGDEPVLTIDGGSDYLIYRNITGTSGYRSFHDYIPKSGDADYKSYTSDDDENAFYVQFFATSYGYDNNLNDVYSDAVYLGLITLNY